MFDDVMYFMSGGEKLLTVYSSFDYQDEGYLFHYYIEGWGENCIVIGGLQTKMSLGDFTLECMNDAYNNHGWPVFLRRLLRHFVHMSCVACLVAVWDII